MIKNKILAFTVTELIITTVIMAVVLIATPAALIQNKKETKQPGKKTAKEIVRCTCLPNDANKKNGYCRCLYSVNDSTIYYLGDKRNSSGGSQGRSSLGTSESTYDYNKGINFYTIELIGGGAGKAGRDNGYPGRYFSTHFPTLYSTISEGTYEGILTGCYLLEVGTGGKGAGGHDVTSEMFGKPSRICTIDCTIKAGLADQDNGLEDKFVTCEPNPGNEKYHPVIMAVAQGGITGKTGVGDENKDNTIPENQIEKSEDVYYGQGAFANDGKDGQDGVIIIK